jgi:hypothetical protein
MTKMVAGSIEYILVDVDDRAGLVTTLIGTTPKFNVYKKADGTQKITNQSCAVDAGKPMQLRCLIDTTLPSLWASDEYELYVTFTSGAETPDHGPFSFFVEAKATI